MTWVKLDDGFYRNRKARLAGKDGRGLFIAGLCHCSTALTDGHIGTYDLPIIAAEAEVRVTVAKTLVDVGLWEKVDDGWIVHDYNRWNRSAQEVRRQRDEGRDRAARSRERRTNEGRTYDTGSGDKRSSSSSPLLVSSSGSSSSTPIPLSDDDEWPDIVAKRRLASREADKGRVGNRKKWLLTTRMDVIADHHEQAVVYLGAHPGATHLEVADHLEPAGNAPTSCARCNGRGVVETGDGKYAVCEHAEAS